MYVFVCVDVWMFVFAVHRRYARKADQIAIAQFIWPKNRKR